MKKIIGLMMVLMVLPLVSSISVIPEDEPCCTPPVIQPPQEPGQGTAIQSYGSKNQRQIRNYMLKTTQLNNNVLIVENIGDLSYESELFVIAGNQQYKFTVPELKNRERVGFVVYKDIEYYSIDYWPE